MSDVIKLELAGASAALPVDKKTLGDFISGLLGQPQSLERDIESPFSIDHQWLVHFVSLILQRIQQQNAPEPLSFEATIFYQDQVKRKISSLPAFEHFSETQNIISVGVKISIALLIQFPSKSVPERQELIVNFDAGNPKYSLFEEILGREVKSGKIRIELRHTERTWADDLYRLIENEVSSVQVKENKLKVWMRKFFFPITLVAVPVFSIVSGAMSVHAKNAVVLDLASKHAELMSRKEIDLALLNEKMDLLVASSNAGVRTLESPTFFIGLLIGFVIFLGARVLARPSPSFVVLTKAAEKNRDNMLDKLKRKNIFLFISMLVSLFLGVAGNFIYDALK